MAVFAPLSADTPRLVDLLDQYLRGEHARVVQTLARVDDFGNLLDQFEADGRAWIEAAGPTERVRRGLTAATVALEAARAGEWDAWKVLAEMPRPPLVNFRGGAAPALPDVASTKWEPPARLLEWGCELIREGHQPRANERVWWHASIAVAERAEDYEFLVGEARPPVDFNTTPVQHVRHAQLRFPDEPRIKLAQGIAEEWHTPEVARNVFESLDDDVDLRGEATMRLGMLAWRQRQDDRALSLFEQVESKTREPWVLYLARFLGGQALERKGRLADAERAYRAALEAVPLAQSSAVALASLLFRTDRRAEASATTEAMLDAHPAPADPWRGYADADDRFWPELIDRLRREIRQ